MSLHKPIYKKLFLIKIHVSLLDTCLGGFFLKTKPGADPKISRREGGELIWLDMVHLHDHTSKKGEDRKHSFVFNFQVKIP